MKEYYSHGAMYAKLEPGDRIETVSVELGDGLLHPGEFVQQLGEKKRSSFSMQDGFYLRYVGCIGKTLLFNVNDRIADGWYYAFEYASPTTLVLGRRGRCWDIEIRHLEKITDPEFVAEKSQQLSLF